MEVLVVIAILAILAAMFFPAFGGARQKARQAVCATRLRQLGLAVSLYAQDNDERLFPYVCYDVKRAGDVQTWGYYLPDRNARGEDLLFDRAGGSLGPYLLTGAMLDCPSAVGFSNGTPANPVADNLLGYAANVDLWAPRPGSPASGASPGDGPGLAAVETPAETLLLADAAQVEGGTGLLSRSGGFSWPPSRGAPGIHARHQDHAEVVWFDGHASALRVGFPAFGYGQASVSRLQARHVGYVLPPGCPVGSACQDFFYELKKTAESGQSGPRGPDTQ